MDDVAGAVSRTEDDLTQFLTFALNYHAKLEYTRSLLCDTPILGYELNTLVMTVLQHRYSTTRGEETNFQTPNTRSPRARINRDFPFTRSLETHARIFRTLKQSENSIRLQITISSLYETV